jgi:hypothetical protein
LLLAPAGAVAVEARVSRTYTLTPIAMLVVTRFAIGNALIDLRTLWVLLRDEPVKARPEG